jgi:hypothetical protein
MVITEEKLRRMTRAGLGLVMVHFTAFMGCDMSYRE